MRKCAMNDGKDVTHQRQDLKTVIDPDQPVVARLRSQIIFLHYIHTRSRHGGKVAHTAFHECAEIRAAFLAKCTGLNAAESDLALCNV